MKRLQTILLAGAIVAAAQTAVADEGADVVRDRLAAVFPDQTITSLEKAPLDGFYEAVLGGEVFYVSADGSYLLHGNLYDVRQEPVNLTDERRNGLRLDALGAMTEDQMIVFGPKDAAHTITVFTDIDCGYCRKLHSEIATYGEQGIRVRYLAFPRSGSGSESFKKAESVWCADDRQQAMTAAKKGDAVEPRTCDNPVQKQYDLGRQVGVTGTPALILENGQLVPGYVPAARLRAMLDAAGTGG
jgi:thiol:disulfide interchange protein DsbC